MGSTGTATLVLALCGVLSCASPSPTVPTVQAVHTVAPGENLYRIGLRYGVPADSIVRANGIRDVTDVQVGTRLVIPPGSGSRSRAAPATTAPASRKADTYADSRQEVRRRVEAAARLSFEWPLKKGELVSRYGYRWGRRHEGIDIAAPRGTRIRAAEAGKVIHSGSLGSYGKVVIVSHAGQYRTLYAHARTTEVRKGQSVQKGQQIAEVGSTGNSTGPHLHFEIRKGERPRDPLLFLP